MIFVTNKVRMARRRIGTMRSGVLGGVAVIGGRVADDGRAWLRL